MRTPFLRADCVRAFCFLFPVYFAFSISLVEASPDTSTSTSAEQISKTWLFDEPLRWTSDRPPSQAENREIVAIINSRRASKPDEIVRKFEQFLVANPNSPWAASLHSNLGRYDRAHGYYTRALKHWETAWSLTKDTKSSNGKAIADYTFAHWTSLLASLGRMDTLTQLFEETAGRNFDSSPLQQIINGTREGLRTMHTRPGDSFKCGTFALHGVARVLQGPGVDTKCIDQALSPAEGFSMTRLVELSSKANLNLVAARRPAGADIIVPSVVHWKQNHYAAIVAEKGLLYRLNDPTFGTGKWVTRDMIDEESSGNFLLPADKLPSAWKKLTVAETDNIFGRGAPNNIDDPDDCCLNGAGGESPPGTSSSNPGGSNGGHGGVPEGTSFAPGDETGGADCSKCSRGDDGTGDAGSSDSKPHCCKNDEGSDVSDGGNPLWAGPDDPNIIVGMPFWKVSEPYITTWIYDRPLGYKPGLGPNVSFKLAYKQREQRSVSTHIFSCGDFWNFSWSSYIVDGTSDVTLIAPGGGDRVYDNLDGTVPEYRTRSRLTRHTSGSDLSGFSVGFPNGSENEYNYIFTNGLDEVRAYLTSRSDPTGHKLLFQYEYDGTNDIHKLKYVIDGDGRTNYLYYTNNSFPAQITSVVDAFSRTNHLFYDASGILSSISDVAQISSSFKYDSQHWITNLITPYGTNTFTYTVNSVPPYDLGGEDTINRAVLIVDPESRTNLYMYRDNSDSIISEGYDTVNDPEYCDMLLDGMPEISTNYYDCPYGIPTLTNPDYYMNLRNSWHWGPRQFSNLSTSDMNSFTATDYAMGRYRHWLHKATTAVDHVTHTLGEQRDPSPDGAIAGMTTVYDYDGGSAVEGTNPYPRVITYLLPETTTTGYRAFRYQWFRYDDLGHVTNAVDNFSLAPMGGGIRRTNQYFYDSNGIDLIHVVGPNGETVGGYAYNANHQIIRATNAVLDVTSYTYDSQGRLTSVHTPAGLTTTNNYFSSGDYTNWIQTRTDVEISRVNSYTYTNNLVLTHADERGLNTTNTWDNLQRLTSIGFPDGTMISNVYDRLDRIRTIDRLGYTTSYLYDKARRLIAVTNALTNVTQYHYCTCGALDSIEDALGHYITFVYDNLGRRTLVVDRDGNATTNYFNQNNELTNVVDATGVSVTNWYNYQGMLVASSNSFGQIFFHVYDNEDRLTNSVDQNGVTVTNAYDKLGRVLIRGYPATGAEEKFGYSPAGIIAYTNQLGYVTRYGYDALRRKIAETNANNEVTLFAYNFAGDLTQLTDASAHSTAWSYDIYGRVTSKTNATPAKILGYSYDADGRLTNRWSLEKGNTIYKYDAVGNLTNITYAVSPAMSYSYDAMNRLTGMSDAVGTTLFSYTDAGLLKSEDGPWDHDMVSYSYSARRRATLSLQQPNASPWSQTYSYDSAERMQSITSPAGTFAYSYDAGIGGVTSSALVTGILLPNGAYATNTFDDLGRLTGALFYRSDNTLLEQFLYGYDLGNRRTSVTNADIVRAYGYDSIGQLIADSAQDSGTAATRYNEQLHYLYDAAGNLAYRTNNSLVESFAVNSLNELTTTTNGGKLTVVGTTTSVATNVTVNGTNALLYADATFAATNMPRVNSYTAIAHDAKGRWDTNVVSVSISTNVTFAYDGNGNMLSDGLHTFEWNDENELTAIYVTNSWRSEFVYDGKLRRRIENDFKWSGSSWSQTNELHFVYDGNLIIQHRDGNNHPTITLTRGKDLSGSLSSLSGAGGIGGLLSMTEPSTLNPKLSTSYYHSDVNGNVTTLISSSQSVVGNYLYDPFGNTLSIAGAKAFVNPYRFSSKPIHELSGLYDYLYRSYSPRLQRWLSKDPFGDDGSLVYSTSEQWSKVKGLQSRLHAKPVYEAFIHQTLYAFVDNDPNSESDAFGLCPCDQKACDKAEDNLADWSAAMAAAILTRDPAAIIAVGVGLYHAQQGVAEDCKGCGGLILIPGMPPTVPPGPPVET